MFMLSRKTVTFLKKLYIDIVGVKKTWFLACTPLCEFSEPALTERPALGNFEESVLNGRLEPVSTVEGFTAEIGDNAVR
jgi:hypothetical protein